jgi:hypothetical protein
MVGSTSRMEVIERYEKYAERGKLKPCALDTASASATEPERDGFRVKAMRILCCVFDKEVGDVVRKRKM